MQSKKHDKRQNTHPVRPARTTLEGYEFVAKEERKAALRTRKMLAQIALTKEKKNDDNVQEIPKKEEVTNLNKSNHSGSFSSLKKIFTNTANSVLKSLPEKITGAAQLNQSNYNTCPQASNSSRPKVVMQNEPIYEEVEDITGNTSFSTKLDRRARNQITENRLKEIKDSLPRSSSRG